jgi:hypothetical protein
VVGAIASIAAWQNARAGRTAAEQAAGAVIEVDGKVYRLDKSVDGRLTELLATNRRLADTAATLARAEGVAQGAQSERDRHSGAQS